MKKLLIFPIIVAIITIVACGGKSDMPANTKFLHEDDVEYAADICFQPIMDELSELFGARYPLAKIIPHYMSEDSVLRMLTRDSLRVAITTRKLTDNEKNIIRASKHNFKQSLFAFDAFALIVNENNPDTVINLNELKGIISGKITDWKQLEVTHKSGELHLVFDNSGSSTVRFMKDSLNGGKDIKGNVHSIKGTNLDVIETVKQRQDVIGVVSTDWLRVSKGDTVTLDNFRDLDVRVMLVGRYGLKDELGIDCRDWVRPYQYYIGMGDYPLYRGVYVISTDARKRSAINNFYYFLTGDGQRVICNSSQLLPRSQVQVRDVIAK